MEDTLQKAVDYLKTKMDIVPRIGLVLGSGRFLIIILI